MIGVIADDITGSNDIGIMFSKSGYSADIYSYDASILKEIPQAKPNVLIFDTDSRLDDGKTAYHKIFHATKDIQAAGALQFFNKTCSVFRGNIGAEFDAMLDALDEEFAIVVLGFPGNGRQTIDSIHYVHGEKLEKSQFKSDPVHPMKESNLVDILQSQTKRKVGSIHSHVVKQGHQEIKQQIKKMKQEVNYVILDVTDQADLKEIAHAVSDEKVICGSSALAEEIPSVRAKQAVQEQPFSIPNRAEGKGLFCAAGSLTPQTIEQIEYMKKSGNQVIELDTLRFIESDNKEEWLNQLTEQIIEQINDGIHVIVHTTNMPDKVQATKEQGLKQGWNNTQISRLISEAIATIASTVIKQTGQYRFVIAGGETSGAVCEALGIRGMRVWEEIQIGLPSCLSHTIPPYLFVLKSGSFGTPDFFEQAFAHLVGINKVS